MPDEPRILRHLDDDGVCTLTLNRPNKLNSWDAPLEDELRDHFARIEGELDDVRVLLLRGAGRAFCAGVDLEVVAQEQTYAGRRLRTLMAARHRLLDWLEGIELPVVAAIHGYCLGGGLELALACDLRLVSEDASFAMPELTFGQVPGSGAASRLVALAGPGVAKDLIMTARRVDAGEAEQLGLTTRVFPADRFDDEVAAFVADLATKPPLALAMTKQMVDTVGEVGPQRARTVERLAQSALLGTEDLHEGLAAASERRPPRFQGR